MAAFRYRFAPSIVATAVAAALLTTSLPAVAMVPWDDRIGPQEAQEDRSAVQQRAANMDPAAAAAELEAAARQSGDPILFLDAADAYYRAGAANSDIDALRASIVQANIALDILHFLSESRNDLWRPVLPAETQSLIDRANEQLRSSNDRMAALEAKQQQAAEEVSAQAQAEAEEDKPKPARPLVIAGGVTTAFGIAGVGAGVTGMVLGQLSQNQVTEPTVYGEEYDEYDTRGKLGNTMAYVGLIGGGALLVTGITLLVIGKKRQKAQPDESAWHVMPTLGGVAISGRF